MRIPRTSPRHHMSHPMSTEFLMTARDIDLRPNTFLSISNLSSSNQQANKTFKPDSLESVFRTNSKATGQLGIPLNVCEETPEKTNPIFAKDNSYEDHKNLSCDAEDIPAYDRTNNRDTEGQKYEGGETEGGAILDSSRKLLEK